MVPFRIIHFVPDPGSGGWPIAAVVNGTDVILPQEIPSDEYFCGQGRSRFVHLVRQRLLELSVQKLDDFDRTGLGPYIQVSETLIADMSFIQQLVESWSFNPRSAIQLHHKAVSLAEDAERTHRYGNFELAASLLEQSRNTEKEAIEALKVEYSKEKV